MWVFCVITITHSVSLHVASLQLVDNLANKLYKAGRIKDLCKDAGFYQRLTLLEKQFPSLSVLLHKNGVLPPAVQRCVSVCVCVGCVCVCVCVRGYG